MKLKKLTLQGFKSFKDKASIYFDHGITGIVGPNGCGKSNIVDALFWVMGEQSAKHLRGASMKDVIFSGSSKYSAASFAEVSLTLDNDTNKYIHIGSNVVCPTEIMLTRKLYRNGETEYRINGIPCRLKDIHEVFMDTGAGSKSYSVVAQGEIDRIVRSKPVERRAMIEEVAGITKFKVRRKESMRKIEQTQENLKRIKDLKDEVHKTYKVLENQAEKALHAKKLQEKIRKNELLYFAHRELNLLKEWKEKSKEFQIKKIENQDFSTEKNELENSLEIERTQKNQQQQELEKQTALYHKLSKELVAKEEKLKFLLRGSKDKEKLQAQRVKENEDLEKRQNDRLQKLEIVQKEWDELQEEKEQVSSDKESENELDHLKDTLSMKESIIEELRAEIQDEKDALREKEQNIFKNKTIKEDLARQSDEILRSLEKAELSLQEFKQAGLAQNQEKNSYQEKILPLENQQQELKEQIQEITTRLQVISPEIKDLTKKVYQKESRLQALVDLQNNLKHAGQAQGLKQFEDQYGAIQSPIITDLFECEKEYIPAVNHLLNKIYCLLIIQDVWPENTIEWTLSKKDQILNFFYPHQEIIPTYNIENKQELENMGFQNPKTFNDVIQLKEHPLRSFFHSLFENCLIFDSFQSQGAVPKLNMPWVLKDTTMMQSPVIGGFEIQLGTSEKKQESVLNYQYEIDEIEVELEQFKIRLAELEIQEKELLEKKSSFSEQNQALEKTLFESKSQLQNIKNTLERETKKESQYILDIENYQKRLEQISTRKTNLISEFQNIETEISNSKDSLADKNDYVDNLEEEYNAIKEEYNQKRDVHINLETQKRTFKVRLDSKKSQLKDLESQIEIEKKKISYNQKLVEGYEEEKTSLLTQVDELSIQTKALADEIQISGVEVKEKKSKLEELLGQMNEREKRLRNIQQMLQKIEKESIKLESSIEKTIIDEQQNMISAFEKYQVNLRQSTKDHLQWNEEDYADLKLLEELVTIPEETEIKLFTFNRLYGQELAAIDGKFKQYKKELSQLGEINWTALNDFEEYKKRFHFLQVQEGQLNQSIKDLEQAISQIDDKSKKKFEQAFNDVNSRFKQVFPYLFRGGSAQLDLVGDFEDPECGMEIVAQPPGKKMQSILLMSGGEKAMTAVALIFSIFLVRPSPFCLLDEVDAPLDDANVGRFNDMLKEMGHSSQFILITHNKKTMELNDVLYGVTMQEPGVSKAVSVQLQ